MERGMERLVVWTVAGLVLLLAVPAGAEFLRVDVKFEGVGCAISTASASLMTDAVKGKAVSEAATIFERFHDLVTSDPDALVEADGLGKLTALAGVREFPMRVKCATLAWHTLQAAIQGQSDTVTTE